MDCRQCALSVFFFGLCASAPLIADDLSKSSVAAIGGQGMIDNHAYLFLEELCDQIDGRVTGSPEASQAVAWAVEKMNAIGLRNAHAEKWGMSHAWRRISAEAELLSPIHRRLRISSMGWVGSTPPGGMAAEVVPVNIFQLPEELKNSHSKWAGKVLLMVHQGSPPKDPAPILTAFGPFLNAAFEAHAIALIGADGGSEVEGMNLTYTGDDGELCSEAGACEIPVVSMTREDQEQIQRLLGRGKTVHIKIDVQNQLTGPAESANVVGEIPGAEHADEVVVVSAHLDSWDLAQGATDDGFGVAAVLGAAEAILRSGQKPRRTLRFVLFTGEEQGELGSRAYVKEHSAEMSKHVAALVIDSGQGPIVRLSAGGHRDLIPAMRSFTESIASFGNLAIDDNISLGTDCASFILAGLPGINVGQDSPDYRYTHHTEADTFEKVKPDVLLRDATILALSAFWIADRLERLATPWTADQTAKMLLERRQDVRLKAFHMWPFGDK